MSKEKRTFQIQFLGIPPTKENKVWANNGKVGANKLCLITQFFNFSILVKGDTYRTEFYSFQVHWNLSVKDKDESNKWIGTERSQIAE